jgi:hypothetical protein
MSLRGHAARTSQRYNTLHWFSVRFGSIRPQGRTLMTPPSGSNFRSRWLRAVSAGVGPALVIACALSVAAAAAPDQKDKKGKKANLSVKATPALSFSPARIVASADLTGGMDAEEELYCPEAEWDWGDGTYSSATQDCEPFEAGKSEVKRHWTSEHRYETQGNYRLQLTLKRGKKTIIAGNTTVQVRPGARDMSEIPQ